MKAIKLEELTVDKVTICDVLDSPTCLQVDAKFKYLVDEFDTTQLRCSKMESDLSSALEKHQVIIDISIVSNHCNIQGARVWEMFSVIKELRSLYPLKQSTDLVSYFGI